MSAGLALQYALVALVLAWSIAYVVRTLWPGTVRRLRRDAALWLLRRRHPASRRLAARIAPAPTAADDGCGTGCSGCGDGPDRGERDR